jgi:hypothetical protein
MVAKLHRQKPLAAPSHPMNLGAERYVDACLALANWHPDSDPAVGLKAYGWVCTNAEEASHLLERPITEEAMEWWQSVSGDEGDAAFRKIGDLSELLRARLDQFLCAKGQTLQALRASANVAVSEIKVDTELEIAPNGQLVHIHRYFPGGGDGVVGMLMAFLLDPNLPFGAAVRRCALESCRIFFLANSGAKGGPKRRYCRPKHQLDADAIHAVERVRRRRLALAKHK